MDDVNRNIFLTGGTGFLGRHFLEAASHRGYRCFVLTRDRKSLEAGRPEALAEVLEGDIQEIGNFSAQLGRCKYLVHLAGETKDVQKMFSTNVAAVGRILEVLSGYPHLRFLHMSSCGVYGLRNHPGDELDETQACYPDNLYEQTKREAEEVIAEYSGHHPVHYVILRPSNVFGEGDATRKLLNLLRKVKQGLFFYVDKGCVLNYVYVKQVTAAMFYFLDKDIFNNEIFNVNTPVHMEKFLRFLEGELKATGKSHRMPRSLIYPFVIVSGLLPRKMQLIDQSRYAALTNRKAYSAVKLSQVMKTSGETSLYEGLASLIAYYRKQHLL